MPLSSCCSLPPRAARQRAVCDCGLRSTAPQRARLGRGGSARTQPTHTPPNATRDQLSREPSHPPLGCHVCPARRGSPHPRFAPAEALSPPRARAPPRQRPRPQRPVAAGENRAGEAAGRLIPLSRAATDGSSRQSKPAGPRGEEGTPVIHTGGSRHPAPGDLPSLRWTALRRFAGLSLHQAAGLTSVLPSRELCRGAPLGGRIGESRHQCFRELG